ncbi:MULTISPECIES: ANR family transcriptional regulator [Lelliottia]|nr:MULTISPECIES: ANR family transcriptional regulator [Lelliottia]
MKTDLREDIVARPGRRSLSMVLAEGGELTELRRYERARYLEFAAAAARHEREGRYTAAAESWGEALKTARGVDVDWSQSRLTLCLMYARSPHPPRTAADRTAMVG